MTRYTVKQLADLVRISVRTLHHYDDIGLLKPAYLGNNGYRYYEPPQLHRLQQVLMYRDFGLSLDQIGNILDAPDFDVAGALRGHRQRLADRLKSLGDLLRVIETTLRRIDGDDDMSKTYPRIWQSEAKTAEYKQWLMDRYSETIDSSIADTRRRITAMTPEERTGLSAQREAWEIELLAAFKDGMTVEALAASELLAWHRALTAAVMGTPCTQELYISAANAFGFAEYRDHFESLAPGLTEWLISGMKTWATDAATLDAKV